MSSPQAETLLGHPRLCDIAPLILAAWDDEFLTPAELLRLREAIAQASGLEESDLVSLRDWLDPTAPPTAAQLRKLRRGLSDGHAKVAIAEAAPQEGWAARFAAVRKLLLLPLQAEVKGGYDVPSFAALSGEEVKRLRTLLDGPNADVRDQVRSLLNEDPAFQQRRTEDKDAHRELVLEQCRVLTRLPLMQQTGPMPAQAVSQFAAAFETIAQYDLSLVVKFGVQFGLYANAIEKLGTAPHHKLLPEIRRAELLGCFAMTERGHGSNVRGVQTRAEYDPKTQEFVIHTPQLSAGKEWIGGAAVHARSSVVFAQLHTGGEHYGIHAFIVPLRTAAGALLPGVRAEDCGQKMGLNGVDNGRLWFDHVRVPRTALLNRFGDVAEDGSYQSAIPSESKRFFVMLGTLVGGRINVAGGALSAAKTGLTVALRYGAQRKQFPDKSGKEQPLLNYQMHRVRLLPALAHAYGLTFAQHALVQRLAQSESDPERARETEMLANGLKAVGTWRAIQTLQDCRECCGGQGYLTSNRLDALRTDTDVFTTFEGDNTVLCQQVAKERLRLYMGQHSAIGADAPPSAAGTTNVPLTAAASADPNATPSVALCKELLTTRDHRLIKALFERVQRRVEKGMEAQAAFEDCQDHTLALARAHVESFVSARFQEAVAAEPVLAELFELYCTACVAEDVGWFLEAGLLSGEQARLLRKHKHELVDRVATRALSYLEAFAIPEICLGPLADPNYLQRSGLVSSS
ncbi:MAG TPA: acyl-CoA dehydrogenase [Polyangiales bacterium]|nr:acyl-CoA dehydrogenase [Polyangiales bacterium]